MLTSNDEKIRFIHKYLSQYKIKDKNRLEHVQSIPLMIRNNGLFNTLMFINKSLEYKLFQKFYSEKIDSKSDMKFLLVIYNMYIKEDRLYMRYSKEFYDLSYQLKGYFKTVKG